VRVRRPLCHSCFHQRIQCNTPAATLTSLLRIRTTAVVARSAGCHAAFTTSLCCAVFVVTTAVRTCTPLDSAVRFPSLSHFSLSKVQTSTQLSLRVAALRLSHPHVVLAHSDCETSRGPGRWLRVHVASAANCICSNQQCVGYKSPRSPLPRIGTFDRCAPPFTLRHLTPIIHSTHPLRGSHLAHPTSACRMERLSSFLLSQTSGPSVVCSPAVPSARRFTWCPVEVGLAS